MFQETFFSDILQYIVENELGKGDGDKARKLPPMDELGKMLGISKGKLREQLIAAQAWGVVEMRPGDGTYVRPYDFYTPVRALVLYSVTRDRVNFDRYYKLRVCLETGFWEDAACALAPEDQEELGQILDRADRKLVGTPVEIPHAEHRAFHLLIFRRLDNGFLQGLLKAYWDAYEAVGLNRYFDYAYYEEMWASHRAMAEAIAAGRYGEGLEILKQHFTLLQGRLFGVDS